MQQLTMLHRFPQSTYTHRLRLFRALLVHFDEVMILVSAPSDLLWVVEDIVVSLLLVVLSPRNRVVASAVVVEVYRHPLRIVNACSSLL